MNQPGSTDPTDTVRLTTAQALVRFLAAQYTERDGERHRLIAGVWGIFGHGNVAGIGQALLQAAVTAEVDLPYRLARNEQAMVHTAAAYAKATDRLSTYACTASTGPGSTNMVTGAALATTNRVPVLLLPSDMFASRAVDPALQQLEDPRAGDVSVNDTLRPVSRYWDRLTRPEQLLAAAPAAMRVLTDPVETGAVTLCLPQDVQAQAHDWPLEFFRERLWRVGRPVPEPAALARAVAAIRASRRPLLVAGGGVVYSRATAELRAFVEATGIPVADTHAGKGALPWDHPRAVGGLGSTGARSANELAREADLVIGVGTRYGDFTTASRTLFQNPHVRLVNVNVARFDTAKLAATEVVADARTTLTALREALAGWRVDSDHEHRSRALADDWVTESDRFRRAGPHGGLPAQSAVIGTLNDVLDDHDVVVNAAGSMPGDLQRLWRARDPKGYHVEYAYSCMGYEIAAGLGVKLAAPERAVFVLVGDGSYLMLAQEIATLVAERVAIVIVVVDNQGFASIGALSESVGSQRFGTGYRYRDPTTGLLDGAPLPVDLAANAASLGAHVIRVDDQGDLAGSLREARAARTTTVVHVRTDPHAPGPPTTAWWDVPVAEVSTLDTTRNAHDEYQRHRRTRRHHL
ncbi:3D-(3,5/4)-trihydroxycyclohexane-1,2-dione acylhydrolase (decyclizing) [Nocardiopsis listeri]|uniref:3D-(3,5/4)-trihydroxycyclohexane-1,2-dione acylhydrolase (decyclizing) n=1 Tax=Nocardiopsis listeri TaxID=53440 RepID=UPI00083194E2|nr:3D-(3,5/4)-trihydroxycyclohexane-1,2-dione acylhydrolase (decyclizing) [Nocardiopsis listeri]